MGEAAVRPLRCRFDQNVRFVNFTLRPKLDEERRRLVALFQENWRERMTVTISLAGGPSARYDMQQPT